MRRTIENGDDLPPPDAKEEDGGIELANAGADKEPEAEAKSSDEALAPLPGQFTPSWQQRPCGAQRSPFKHDPMSSIVRRA